MIAAVSRWIGRRGAPSVAVVGAACTYLTLASLLVYRYNSINGDALSRVENGALMIFSRDPHLAAVGFVWNPLPSILATPFLLLKPLFPSLLSHGFAGNLVAALSGAASAGVMFVLLRDLGIRPVVRWVLVVAFAAHPMVLYAGSNGMSEAPYLLFLLLGCRYLLRWMATQSTGALVACGLALGVGYLTRYEVIVAAAGVTGLVAVVRFGRADGGWRQRAREASVDVGIVAGPVLFAFVGWAVVSWVIVGSPFEQFTSEYGNRAQVAVLNSLELTSLDGTPANATLGYSLRQLLLINAAWPLAVMASLVVAWRRRSLIVLAPWAVFGSILAFSLAASIQGQTAGWLRFYIVAVPFVVLLGASMVATAPGPPRAWPSTKPTARTALAVTMALVGLVTSSAIVKDHSLAREESGQLHAVFDAEGADPASRLALKRLTTERRIAKYLDAQELAQGSVLVDVAFGFQIVTQSRRPKTFVVTSDRDFAQSLADPATFGIGYLLVPPNEGQGRRDAINRSYPTLYQDGAGIATMLNEFEQVGDGPVWRLYRVTPES